MSAHIIEYNDKPWVVFWICFRIDTVQKEKYVIHGTDRSFSDTIWCIRHYTLDKSCDALLFVVKSRTYHFCEFIDDSLVTPQSISIVEPWCVNHGHICSCTYFDDTSDGTIGLFMFKSTLQWIVCKVLFVQFGYCRKRCGFTLTTLTNSD